MRTNQTSKDILINILTASLGLFLFGTGEYLTIQADIGVGPWDTFYIGLSQTTGFLYGNISIAASMIILLLDIAMKEKIGIGMFLDAFIVGKTVDLLNFLHLIATPSSMVFRVLLFLCGIALTGFSLWFYMRAGLGCGPRDSMLVGFSRRLPRIPIVVISISIQVVVTILGWILGGPIGLGTILFALLEGPAMSLTFRATHFVATDVKHQSLGESFRVLWSYKKSK